jgi:hypothetical protein
MKKVHRIFITECFFFHFCCTSNIWPLTFIASSLKQNYWQRFMIQSISKVISDEPYFDSFFFFNHFHCLLL